MRGALKEELNDRFPWLFHDLGFRIIAHDFSYKAMGSSLALLESDSLRVKFVNDGVGISVSVASLAEPEGWMELRFLWLSLKGDSPSPELEGWAWFLRDHFDEITTALGPRFESTKAAFEQKSREGQEKPWSVFKPNGT